MEEEKKIMENRGTEYAKLNWVLGNRTELTKSFILGSRWLDNICECAAIIVIPCGLADWCHVYLTESTKDATEFICSS
ncbi:hypothetical protein HZH66_004962 [Vespula vulgaris]|uniref:Uncharacterized protein n=1 Tax=Vespula vulgaris TaxID=7454 RepID=A0A834NBC3_VESVU|nr:hypothetical protein HZH66_004962 [Vespula vulgaris]